MEKNILIDFANALKRAMASGRQWCVEDVVDEFLQKNTNQHNINFLDSYGNNVVDDCTIIIEENYNYSFLNGKEAVVKWNSKNGLFEYYSKALKNPTSSSFYGIHKFKVINK